MQNPDIRKITNFDEFPAAKILKLMRQCMPHIDHDLEVLKWQYFNTPNGNANLYYIENNNEIISFFAMVCHRIRVGNDLIVARSAQDVMTHADFRGLGHLHVLGRIARESILAAGEIGITFPNQNSERSFRRNGWIELCQVPVRQKYLFEEEITRRTKDQGFVIKAVDISLLKSKKSIWQETDFYLGFNRDNNYLQWRYSKPKQVYMSFIIGDDMGFIVVKIFESLDGKILHICEFFLKQKRDEAVAAALDFVGTLATQWGCYKITAWLTPDHRYAKAFGDFGLKLQYTSRFIFITGNETILDKINKAGAWHFSQGDSDVY